MDNTNLERLDIASVRVVGKEGLPFWTILHFFDKTINNHMKLTTIQKICELSAQGIPDKHFIIAENSVGVYQQEKIKYEQFSDYKVLETKSRNPKNFWDLIINLKRPVVFLDNGRDMVPLYDFTYDESLRITSFHENSPFSANFEGAGSSLVDLFYAKEREERRREEHLNNYLGQAAQNVESIVRASQVIDNPNTPPGIRVYATDTMEKLLKAQDRLNEKVGINTVHIDRRV